MSIAYVQLQCVQFHLHPSGLVGNTAGADITHALPHARRLPADNAAALPAPLFRSFQVTRGGSGGIWSSGGGVWVAANQTAIDIMYSTVTCHEFYRWWPGANQQALLAGCVVLFEHMQCMCNSSYQHAPPS